MIINRSKEVDFKTLYSLVHLYDLQGKNILLKAIRHINLLIIQGNKPAIFEAKEGQIFPIFLLGDKCLSVAFILVYDGYAKVLDDQLETELKILPPKEAKK